MKKFLVHSLCGEMRDSITKSERFPIISGYCITFAYDNTRKGKNGRGIAISFLYYFPNCFFFLTKTAYSSRSQAIIISSIILTCHFIQEI